MFCSIITCDISPITYLVDDLWSLSNMSYICFSACLGKIPKFFKNVGLQCSLLWNFLDDFWTSDFFSHLRTPYFGTLSRPATSSSRTSVLAPGSPQGSLQFGTDSSSRQRRVTEIRGLTFAEKHDFYFFAHFHPHLHLFISLTAFLVKYEKWQRPQHIYH
jgi:hypothetical protein